MDVPIDRQLKRMALHAVGAQEKASAAVAARDQIIYEAKHDHRLTYAKIASITELSHQRVRQIIDAERKKRRAV